MDIKKLLKNFKLHESTISMVLGALVVIVVGFLAINFFKNQETGETLPTGEITEEVSGPTIIRDGKTYHIVQEGDSLWTISEKYYNTGYSWSDIAEANDLTNSNQIEEGQELFIPELGGDIAVATLSPTLSPSTSPTPTLKVIEPTEIMEEELSEEEMASSEEAIVGTTYTVQKGDNLWTIAERAYGDGYKWVEIAKENELVNPNIIHAGNVFVLPR